jgi:hypothetical protein
MRPYPEEIIQALQRGMAAHFLPELTSSYAQAQFMPAQLLFGIALRDAEGAAQSLIDANRELRALLQEATDVLRGIDREDAAAAAKVLERLPAPAGDVRLSSLRAELDGLRTLFCEIAPVLEPAADDPDLALLRDVRLRTYAWFSQDARKRTVPILNN